jgi:NAD-dependent deacetylase sirtuin 2
LQELFPGGYCPTPAHFFLKLLHDKGLLLSTFTQNIDGLEQLAGLPAEKVVPAHGSFDGECMCWVQVVMWWP